MSDTDYSFLYKPECLHDCVKIYNFQTSVFYEDIIQTCYFDPPFLGINRYIE